MSKLRKEIEALTLQKRRARDYDPEDNEHQEADTANQDSASDNSDQEDGDAGREHYEQVGKSKLRRSEPVSLGPKYGGVAVSRHAMTEDLSDDEDPFAVGEKSGDHEDSDEDEDEELEDGVELESDQAPNGVQRLDQASSASEETDTNTDMEDDEDEEEEDSDGSATTESETEALPEDKRQQGRAILRAQQRALSAGLATSLTADVRKGRAVMRQRQAFDRILDARMKLQRGVVAASELQARQPFDDLEETAERALDTAKSAALQLFTEISSFRDALRSSEAKEPRSGEKRKRGADLTPQSSITEHWRVLTDLENDSMPSRKATIDKWAARIKSADPSQAAATSKGSIIDPDSQSRNLTTVLDTFVINEFEKLSQSVTGEAQPDDLPSVYDDTAFYQSLLRDLIASRSAMSASASNMSASLLPQKLHPSGNTNNKKNVDTKASKGRKIRYTVHEKLQNFMAAEGDTGRNTAMWTERGKEQFFGSLFGQDRALQEDSDAQLSDDNADSNEHEALRLFAA